MLFASGLAFEGAFANQCIIGLQPGRGAPCTGKQIERLSRESLCPLQQGNLGKKDDMNPSITSVVLWIGVCKIHCLRKYCNCSLEMCEQILSMLFTFQKPNTIPSWESTHWLWCSLLERTYECQWKQFQTKLEPNWCIAQQCSLPNTFFLLLFHILRHYSLIVLIEFD